MSKKHLLIAASSLLVLAVTGHAETMKPGLWEVSSESQMDGMKMPAMPKLSPDQLAQMQKMGIKMPTQGPNGGMATTIQHCITPEQANRDVPVTSKEDGHCKTKNVKKTGNTVSYEMECTGEHAATGSGSVTWNGSDAYSGTSTVTTSDGKHGPMTMNMKFSGKWLSATCPKK